MDISVETLNISDCVIENVLDHSEIENYFGNLLDWNHLNKMFFDFNCTNQWVWITNSSLGKIVSSVYNHLNNDSYSLCANWMLWHNLWRLPGAPRVKTFLLRLFHGRIPTFEYLYNLTIGP